MKFSDRLGRRPRKPFHSAIATTFAVEFAAVEEIMLPQLMASGATNLLLIADDRMAAMALSDGSRLPIALGRDYALHSPPASDGIFHPKIILQLGRETGRAFVSSARSEEHTSELQSLMRNSYAVFCLTKKITTTNTQLKTNK